MSFKKVFAYCDEFPVLWKQVGPVILCLLTLMSFWLMMSAIEVSVGILKVLLCFIT